MANTSAWHALPGWNLRFIHYFLDREDFWIKGGSAQPYVQEQASLGQPVVQFSLLEQQSIVDYLDRETAQIDALIGKQERLIETLRERQASLLASSLLNLEGKPRSVASLALDGGFHDGDWVESKDQDPAGDIRLLQLADVGDGRFRDRSDRRINDEAFVRLRCSAVLPGDVLIARMPDPLGRACVVPNGLGRTITVVDVAVLRVDETRFDKRFVVYALNEHGFRKRLESLQDGATRQRIPRKVLGRQVFSVPPLEVQRGVADMLDEGGTTINALIAKAEQFIALARDRRSALITAAVTGQIDVRSAS